MHRKHKTEKNLLTEKLDEPLMYGFPNELWSARLYAEESDTEFRVSLTDRNTLYLQQYDAPAACTAIYTREESLMPEALTQTMADEPDDALMFYWAGPAGGGGKAAGGAPCDRAGERRGKQAAADRALVRNGYSVLHRQCRAECGRHAGRMDHGIRCCMRVHSGLTSRSGSRFPFRRRAQGCACL